MSNSKVRSPIDLWGKCERKLIVYVLEGISLVTKHGAGNPYIKLIYDKQKQKTQTLKHAEDARWKEMFYFEIVDDYSNLMLEVWTKSGLSDKLIGTCTVVNPSELEPERVIDRTYDLELPSNVKNKDKDALDARIGNVHLRLYFSCEDEIPPVLPPNQCYNTFYREHRKKMQTGDLIMYSGVGSVDAMSKLYSGTNFSRVGIIVRLPNKWTGKEQLYVFEVTRNISRELDAFRDVARPGPNFFNLEQHVHIVNATNIWWVPLKVPLEKAPMENLIDWLKEYVMAGSSSNHHHTHNSNTHNNGVNQTAMTMDVTPAPPKEMEELLHRFDLTLNKSVNTVAEICSSSIAIAALRLGGKRFSFDKVYLPVVHMLTQEHFNDPVILRERNGVPLPKSATLSNLSAGYTSTSKLSLSNKENRATVYNAEPLGDNPTDPADGPFAAKESNGRAVSPSISVEPAGEVKRKTPSPQPPAPSSANLVVFPTPTGPKPPAPSSANLQVQTEDKSNTVSDSLNPAGGQEPPLVAAPKPTPAPMTLQKPSKKSLKPGHGRPAAPTGKRIVADETTGEFTELGRPAAPTGKGIVVDETTGDFTSNSKPAARKQAASAPPPIDTSSKPKKSPGKHRSGTKAPKNSKTENSTDPTAFNENLDDNTKAEITKRRRSSIKIVPNSSSSAILSSQNSQASAGLTPITEESTPPVANTRKALVLWTFDAENPGELSVKEGDAVLVLDEAGEWAFIDNHGVTGAVPTSFLSIV